MASFLAIQIVIVQFTSITVHAKKDMTIDPRLLSAVPVIRNRNPPPFIPCVA